MIECPHWSATEREGVGSCAIGKGGGRPSTGFCKFCLGYDIATLPFPAPSGPGTELKKLLSSIGLSGKNCSCNAHARQMDQWGPDKCEENLDTIVGWLRDEASRRKLPFQATAAGLLVRAAIGRARGKVEDRKHTALN